MKITIKDIARKAQVSPITVSRALNDKEDINPDTKNRIVKIANDLGYFPNMLAQSLKSKKSKTLGVILRDISDPFYAEILQGISLTAAREGYQIILSISSRSGVNLDLEYNTLKLVLQKQVDGVLIIPEHEDPRYFAYLQKIHTPFVLLNRVPKEIQCDYVSTDQQEGSRLAMSHFIKKGKKHIAYLVRRPLSGVALTRMAACEKTLLEHGLSKDSIRVVECDDTIVAAYEQTKRTLKQNSKVDGVYAWDDVMAMGAVKAAIELGCGIPDDIGIIGYDDIELAKFFNPALTTVRQNIQLIGRTAAEILIEKINNDVLIADKTVILRPELIVRETA
ncbi:MAG TPA: LacI family DNA-binding transcriptional regulator [bacterium]|nr:LacI family DNA-binding transcriptional regulator [bacterium]